MLQDVHLFSGTIADNIRLGNPAIDDERVRDAARAVHAEPFIVRLPDGYASAVAERGSTLSVGQKQLLSFARALAFDPRVLVLDEATSSVDTETELIIRDALHVLMAGRTTIAIAHRLSTIQDMDKILVLHKGQLRESGTHQELLAAARHLLQAVRAAVPRAAPRRSLSNPQIPQILKFEQLVASILLQHRIPPSKLSGFPTTMARVCACVFDLPTREYQEECVSEFEAQPLTRVLRRGRRTRNPHLRDPRAAGRRLQADQCDSGRRTR